MNAAKGGFKQQQMVSSFLVNAVLIIICLIWIIPAFGVLVTSFRNSEDIFGSGWWSIFPHRGYIKADEIKIDPSVDVNGPIEINGVTHTFEEWRNGVVMPDGTKLTWFGNKRTRTLEVEKLQWVGFDSRLTLENYKNVLSGLEIRFKDANGNEIIRQGSNLSTAFLNSIAVAVPPRSSPFSLQLLLPMASRG